MWAAAAEFAARRLVLGGIPCIHLQVATERDFRAALRRLPPQLILADLELTRFNGLTALEIARRELPEVLSSSLGTQGEEHAIERCAGARFDYVLEIQPVTSRPRP